MRGVRAARRNPERSRGNSAQTAIAISARRASLLLRLLLLRLIFLIPRMLLINRILPRRPLHANGNLHLRLVDVIVVAESLESLGQHLHAQFAVRHAVEIRLVVRVRVGRRACPRDSRSPRGRPSGHYAGQSIKIVDVHSGAIVRELTYKHFGPTSEVLLSRQTGTLATVNAWRSPSENRADIEKPEQLLVFRLDQTK